MVKGHFTRTEPSGRAPFKEQPRIGLEPIVLARSAQESRDAVNRRLVGFDFDVDADGRFVDGDHGAGEPVFLAIFLTAKPLLQTESREERLDRLGAADARFDLLARFDRTRFGGSFEGHQRVRAVAPDSKRAAGAAETLFRRVEETILDQTPRDIEAAARGNHCLTRRLDAPERELDLLF